MSEPVVQNGELSPKDAGVKVARSVGVSEAIDLKLLDWTKELEIRK